MKVFYSIPEIDINQSTIVTVGSFDGLHLGHQRIINQLHSLAENGKYIKTLVTFHPHPKEVLAPSGTSPIELLTPLEEKVNYLKQLGLQVVVVIPFTREFSKTGYREFTFQILIGKLKMKKIVVGYDHAFGRNREGHPEQLKELGKEADFSVTVVRPFYLKNEVVNSSKIRHFLKTGQVEQANRFLGRRYKITGVVEKGNQRGSSLGYPTANIRPLYSNQLIPAQGVYAVDVQLNGQHYQGMMNIGHRPTFNFDPLTLEVHIFNFSSLIYGESIDVFFKKFIRNEKKFRDQDELKRQLDNDKKMCLKL